MGRVVLYMQMTLDGFIAAPDGSLDAVEPGREEMAYATEAFDRSVGVIFGRRIYEGFVEYWDAIDLDDPSAATAEVEFARIFQRLPRVVVSRSLREVPSNTTLISEDVVSTVRRAQDEVDGDLLLVCGPELLAALVDGRVVDEFRFLIRPVVLGAGIAPFGQVDHPVRLRVVSTRAFDSGSVLHISVPAQVDRLVR